jgi:hypothetical protein
VVIHKVRRKVKHFTDNLSPFFQWHCMALELLSGQSGKTTWKKVIWSDWKGSFFWPFTVPLETIYRIVPQPPPPPRVCRNTRTVNFRNLKMTDWDIAPCSLV